MPQKLLATPEMAAEYSRWFVNRLAYTRQSDRPHPDSGRHFYYASELDVAARRIQGKNRVR